MKKNILKFLVLIAVIGIGITACQKDEPVGSDRDKFLGTWKVNSKGSKSGTLNYQMTINAGNSSPDQILITNFDLQAGTTIAYVSGSGFSISKQVVNGETIEGSGTYNSNSTLSFHYTADDGVAIDDVNATATK